MLIVSKNVRWGEGTSEAPLPGIIAFDRTQADPHPQLRPYVWSRERADHWESSGLGAKAARLGALIVGPMGSLPRGGTLRLA